MSNYNFFLPKFADEYGTEVWMKVKDGDECIYTPSNSTYIDNYF